MDFIKQKLVLVGQFLVLLSTIGNSQNLIPNPSFEKVTEITNRWSGTFSAFNRRVQHWDSPTQGSPDILFVGTLDKMFPKRPNVPLQNHRPRTGKLMVGIKVFGCLTKNLHCKEYIQIKLKKPLQKGKKYAYEFWLNPVSTSIKINSFGIALSNTRVKDYSISGLLNLPVVAVDTSLIENSPNDWQKVAGVFQAPDTSSYFILGNFYPDTAVVYKIEKEGLDYGYYLVDDVSLIPLDSKEQSVQKTTRQSIVLKDFLFDFDKAVLKNNKDSSLITLLHLLKKQAYSSISIHGHTDNIGEEHYNIVLSEKRAAAIKIFLSQHGVPEDKITIKGLGSFHPIASNNTATNRQLNRRVEVIITSVQHSH